MAEHDYIESIAAAVDGVRAFNHQTRCGCPATTKMTKYTDYVDQEGRHPRPDRPQLVVSGASNTLQRRRIPNLRGLMSNGKLSRKKVLLHNHIQSARAGAVSENHHSL